MKAQELRIGNQVNYDGSNFEIESFDRESAELDSVVIDCHANNVHIDRIKPIPLTREWIKGFGFESPGYSDNDKIHRINKDDIWIMENEDGFYLYEYSDTKIKYVHQLQNLYFALTGEELKLKS